MWSSVQGPPAPRAPVIGRTQRQQQRGVVQVAAGEADLYPRMGRTMEWDTAAGHAVVEAAGGRVLTEEGAPLLYGKTERGYDNPHFIVYGDVSPA